VTHAPARLVVLVALTAAASGCAFLPSVGPSRADVQNSSHRPESANIQVVDVDDQIVRQLLAQRVQKMFSETLGDSSERSQILGYGDVLEVSVWEAPPATLFSAGAIDGRGAITAARATIIPEEMIDSDGTISVPFAGRIPAAGRSLSAVQNEIVERLTGKANHPEVIVRLTFNASRHITVVGDVNQSVRVPLNPSDERLLDALAAAGGVRQPINKMTIQVTRGNEVQSLPLDTIIRDPKQNISLRAGDVVTIKSKPRSLQLVRLNIQQNPPPTPDYLEQVSAERPASRRRRPE